MRTKGLDSSLVFKTLGRARQWQIYEVLLNRVSLGLVGIAEVRRRESLAEVIELLCVSGEIANEIVGGG